MSRFSREQTLVAPAGPARAFYSQMDERQCEAVFSGENFGRRRCVSDQISESCVAQGVGRPRLAAADNRHAVPAKKANRRTAMMQKPKPPRPPKPPAPPPPEPLPPAA